MMQTSHKFLANMYPFRRTCKQAAAIVVAREDRTLSLTDRVGLKLHIAICTGCKRFERQILTVSSAMKQWRNYSESDPDLGPVRPPVPSPAQNPPSSAGRTN